MSRGLRYSEEWLANRQFPKPWREKPTEPTKPTARRSKYGNKRVERHGIKFDSIKEADRWDTLLAMEAAGEIKCLVRQVPFALIVNGVLVATYRADAVYETAAGEKVIEDTKSVATARDKVYVLKRKLFEALYGRRIHEL